MVHVEKYHGAGNDFAVVDAAAADVPDREAFARAVCDRDDGLAGPVDGLASQADGFASQADGFAGPADGLAGPADGLGGPEDGLAGPADGLAGPAGRPVGADGVLFLALDREPSPPRVGMTLVQPDGSRPAACGNGARCAAAWAAARTGADEVLVGEPAGTRRATVVEDGRIAVEVEAPTLSPDAVPVAAPEPLVERAVAGLTVTAVRAGVPHAVAFVDDVATVDLERVAPPVRHADVFPAGANVTVASERPDGGFAQRTYERGVESETDACGTGAVALVAAAAELGRVGTPVTAAVSPPGGELEVALGDDAATLTGPVAREFETEVPDHPE